MGINLGALVSPLAASYLRTLRWDWAFGAAGIGMVIALTVFTVFRKHVASGEIRHRIALATTATSGSCGYQEAERIALPLCF